ncbi:MAG: HEAT repeat domain-containing protein [Planctomycetota bacterium]
MQRRSLSVIVLAALTPLAGAATCGGRAAAAMCGPSAAAQDVEKDLRSKDPAVREAGVRLLIEQGGDKVEKKLLAALKDDDWLVRLAALDGLAGHGTRDALKPLLEQARNGPFRLARERAAAALAAVLPREAADALYDDLRGKNGPIALPALAALSIAGARPEATDRLGRWLKDEAPSVRLDAARARIVCAAPEARAAALAELFESGDLAQRAVALEGLAQSAQVEDLAALAQVLASADLAPVLERRAEAAAVAALATLASPEQRAQRLEDGLLGAVGDAPEARARLARIIARLGERVPQKKAQGWLERLCGSDSPIVRAAAAKALIAIGGDAAQAFAVTGLAADTSARVRAQHVVTAQALGAATTQAGEAALVKAATSDADARVRELAAIALGREGAGEEAVRALAAASKDSAWEVAVSAAIALGRTRSEVAQRELALLAKHTDWRLRGAAAMGLYYVARPDAVAPLLALLNDPNPSVQATADRALALHAGREGEAVEPREWAAWWKDNLAKVRFVTPDEARARREKYGYSVPDRDIYKGLDVMVIPGRGDHMEGVLERLDIKFRTIQAGQLGDGGVHPFGILVAGCTGEVEARDLDVIRWYVRAGGALFTSCWALTYTVDASFPGVVTKFPSPAEVLDRINATPVAVDSPYLTGVFDGGVVPIYELQGAHLIQVLDPERVEVLIDSPEAALRHGSGDLAAWFRAGHGVVLDSVNHFDLQGLELALDLKSPEELQGYAVDHMGLSLKRLRELAGEKWWKSRSKAAKEIDDLSAFRILTNFVREKRINGS